MVISLMAVMVVLSCGPVHTVIYITLHSPIMKQDIIMIKIPEAVVEQYTCRAVMWAIVIIPHLTTVLSSITLQALTVVQSTGQQELPTVML